MLAGALTQEDEDAVLAELDAITQVGVGLNALLLPFSWSHVGQVAEDISCSPAGGVRGEGITRRDTGLRDNSVHNCDLIIKQGDDVALPEVPTQPVPQRPPEAEPGTAAVLSDSSNMYISILTHAFFVATERKEAKKKEDREMLAA